MKKITLLLLTIAMIASCTITAQVAVTTDGSNADASAMLDVKSTDKGFLPPRMTKTEIGAITTPAEGLIVYDTETHKPVFYNGSIWSYYDGTEMLYIGKFHQGGVIFYLYGSGGGLICDINDLSSGIQWYNGSYITTGATGTAIGTGQANTTSITNVQGAGSYAAQLCDDYDDGTYADWFLPSKDELNAIYDNKAAIDVTAVANGGTALGVYYWSSTEHSSNHAYLQYFTTGTPYLSDKAVGTYDVRAVRTF